MTKKNRKMLIKEQLMGAENPIKASDFAEQFDVSRQTIVGDIALLRAQGEQIISTSRGYEYEQVRDFEEIVVCRHFPDQAEQEMNLIVAEGVSIKDVTIDHPLYGQLSGQMRINNRHDVQQFIQHMRESKGHLLSELTGGIHSHTLSADSQAELKRAKKQLEISGILYHEV